MKNVHCNYINECCFNARETQSKGEGRAILILNSNTSYLPIAINEYKSENLDCNTKGPFFDKWSKFENEIYVTWKSEDRQLSSHERKQIYSIPQLGLVWESQKQINWIPEPGLG